MTAPHTRPATVIGAAAEVTKPAFRICSATGPGTPSYASIRAGSPVRSTSTTGVSPTSGTMLPIS